MFLVLLGNLFIYILDIYLKHLRRFSHFGSSVCSTEVPTLGKIYTLMVTHKGFVRVMVWLCERVCDEVVFLVESASALLRTLLV